MSNDDKELCSQWPLYFDGGGTQAWREHYEQHLDACAECSEQLRVSREWDQALRKHADESVASFHWAPETNNLAPVTRSTAGLATGRWAAMIATAAGLICCIVAWQLYRHSAEQVAEVKPGSTVQTNQLQTNDIDDQANQESDGPPAVIRKLTVSNHISTTKYVNDEFTFVMLYPTTSADDDSVSSQENSTKDN